MIYCEVAVASYFRLHVRDVPCTMSHRNPTTLDALQTMHNKYGHDHRHASYTEPHKAYKDAPTHVPCTQENGCGHGFMELHDDGGTRSCTHFCVNPAYTHLRPSAHLKLQLLHAPPSATPPDVLVVVDLAAACLLRNASQLQNEPSTDRVHITNTTQTSANRTELVRVRAIVG